MQEQKNNLNKKIFFKPENLKVISNKIIESIKRINNWLNQELSQSPKLPHEFQSFENQQERLREKDQWQRYF